MYDIGLIWGAMLTGSSRAEEAGAVTAAGEAVA